MREFVVCNGLAIKSDNTKNKIMNRYVFSLLVFLLLSIITSFITNNSFIDKIYPILGIILTLGICFIVEYIWFNASFLKVSLFFSISFFSSIIVN